MLQRVPEPRCDHSMLNARLNITTSVFCIDTPPSSAATNASLTLSIAMFEKKMMMATVLDLQCLLFGSQLHKSPSAQTGVGFGITT